MEVCQCLACGVGGGGGGDPGDRNVRDMSPTVLQPRSREFTDPLHIAFAFALRLPGYRLVRFVRNWSTVFIFRTTWIFTSNSWIRPFPFFLCLVLSD